MKRVSSIEMKKNYYNYIDRTFLLGIIDFAGTEANTLYLALGFEKRDTNVYRMIIPKPILMQ